MIASQRSENVLLGNLTRHRTKTMVSCSGHDRRPISTTLRRGKETVEEAGRGIWRTKWRCRRRIILEGEHAGQARPAETVDLDRLASEDEAVGIEGRPDRSLDEREGQALAGDELLQEGADLGKEDSLPLDEAEAARRKAVERGQESLR